jgi:hypothetical protein
MFVPNSWGSWLSSTVAAISDDLQEFVGTVTADTSEAVAAVVEAAVDGADGIGTGTRKGDNNHKAGDGATGSVGDSRSDAGARRFKSAPSVPGKRVSSTIRSSAPAVVGVSAIAAFSVSN